MPNEPAPPLQNRPAVKVKPDPDEFLVAGGPGILPAAIPADAQPGGTSGNRPATPANLG